MLIIILCIIIILSLVYWFKNHRLDRIEAFANPQVEMQTVHELISDRDQLFKFANSRFTYLDRFNKRMQKALKRLKNREDEIHKFLANHKKNVRFLQKMNSNTRLIKPVYTKRDLQDNKSKIETLKRFYQHHLKQYLKLYNLNNLLLIQQLYCQERHYKCPSLSKRLVNTMKSYKTLKTQFNKEFADILDEL